jgi:hypothetical protein
MIILSSFPAMMSRSVFAFLFILLLVFAPVSYSVKVQAETNFFVTFTERFATSESHHGGSIFV